MNTDTPDTTIPREDPRIPRAGKEPIITGIGLATEINNEDMNALQVALPSMQTADMDAQRAATARLDEVIKKGKGRKREKEERKEEKMKESGKNGNITTTTTTRWVMAGVLVPPRPVDYHTYLDFTNMGTSSSPSPIIRGKATDPDKVTEAPWAGTSHDAPQDPRHQSMRIIQATQKSAQGKLAVSPPVQGEGEVSTDVPIEEAVAGLSSQILRKTRVKVGTQKGKEGPIKAVTKVKSPVLKPRAGAGITKKTDPRGLKGKTAARAKAKAKVEVEKEVEQGEENQSIANIITTDKATKASRTRAPRQAPQAPQRRSKRVIERAQRSGQDNLAVDSTVQEEEELARDDPVKGETAEGPSGGIARKTVANVGMGKEKEGHAKAVTKAKSPVLKPKAGAGVSKKGGRDVTRGGRSSKAGEGKKASA